jgi:hypothetical protein
MDEYAYLVVDFLNPGETYTVKFDGSAFTSSSGAAVPEGTATIFQVAPRIAVKHSGARADVRGPVTADAANDLILIGGDGVSSVSRSSTFRASKAERGDGPFPLCDGCVSESKTKDHLIWRSADPPGFRLTQDGEKRSNLGYTLIPEVETVPCTCPVCIDGPYNWRMPEFGELLDYFTMYEHTSGFDTTIDWICQVGPDWGMEETQGYYHLTRDVTPPLLCTRQQEYFAYWVTNRDACIPKPCYGFPPMPYHPVPDANQTLGPHNCSISATRTVAGDPTPFWFTHAETCVNYCSSGYFAPDPRTIRCDRGIYPAPHPTCDPRSCVGLNEPNQGIIPSSEAKYMEEIAPICNYGWEPDGLEKATCVALNITQTEGLADFDSEVSCRRKTCAPFPDLGDGSSIDCNADDTYLYEQVCSIQCDYGFALDGGIGPNSGTISCTHDSGVPLVGWGPPSDYLCSPLKCAGFTDGLALIANSGATTCYEGMGIDETCVVSCAPGYSIYGDPDRRGDDVPAECLDDNGVGTISEVLRANNIPQVCEMLPCPDKYTPAIKSLGFTLSDASTSSGTCSTDEPMGGGNICAFQCSSGTNSNDAAFLTCIAGTYYGCTADSPGCDTLIATPVCLDSSIPYEEITVIAAVAEFSLPLQSLNRMVNKAEESHRALQNGFAVALDVEPDDVKFTKSDPAKIARSGRRLSDEEMALLVLNFEITVDNSTSSKTLALLERIRKITAQDGNATATLLNAVNAAFEEEGMAVTVDGVMISEPMIMTIYVEVVTPSPTPLPTPAPEPPPIVPPEETSYFWLWVFLGVLFIVGAGGGGYTVYQRQKHAVKKTAEERRADRVSMSSDDI